MALKYEAPIRLKEIFRPLKDGSVYVDEGPMQMRIHVWQGVRPETGLALAGAEKACSLLEELAANKWAIVQNILKIETSSAFPRIVNRMIESVKKAGDWTMTPLAAVAGTVADEVADFICGLERASKVIVNNGGDIAIRLEEEAIARIGVQEDLCRTEFSHLLIIGGSHGIGGVATSGLGGRSFTKGIASAVTALAETSSMADTAATIIANAVSVVSPQVRRAWAEGIYPDADIPGHLVTVSVGQLSPQEVRRALKVGAEVAEGLRRKGLIMGALLALRGEVVMSQSLQGLVCRAGRC